MRSLSIIVPIYNGEKYLRKCLDSILAQKYTDFELILVDDGSKDSSLEICREYEKKDSRVIVIHTENGGPVASRKNGVNAANGEYIGFVDCDDYIDEDMFSQMFDALQKNKSDIVVCGIIIEDTYARSKEQYNLFDGYFDKHKITEIVIPKMLVYSDFIKFGIIPAVYTKLAKAEIVKSVFSNLPNNMSIGEDVAITAHSVMIANSLTVVRYAGYHYVQYDSSLVHKFNPKRFEHICNLYNNLKTIDNEDYQRQVPIYISYLIYNAVAECITKSGYSKKETRRYIRNILDNSISEKCLKTAITSGISFKDKVKMFLMKHKMIFLLEVLVGKKR